MEVAIKTDVDIVQELLAVYTARKEAIEKIERQTNDDSFKKILRGLTEQTDRFIAALMDELSLYGDAVTGEANRNNSYLNTWKTISPQLSNMNDIDLQQQFQSLENYLADYYRQINATRSAEAGSLDEVLAKQEVELKS